MYAALYPSSPSTPIASISPKPSMKPNSVSSGNPVKPIISPSFGAVASAAPQPAGAWKTVKSTPVYILQILS